jgi:hypothetical protein
MQKYKELLKELEIEPLVDYSEPINEMGEIWREALARMYSDRGFRSYLENAINIAIKSSAMNGIEPTDIAFRKGRIEVLKELYIISKNCYDKIEKIKANKIKQ